MLKRIRPECGRSAWRTWVVACAVVGLIASAAHASHQRGIRVTVTGVDVGTRTVEVDVTGYTGEEGEVPPTTEEYLNIGGEETGQSAIAWGEGEAIGETNLDFESVVGNRARFRSSFSHSYESNGPFTIVVVSDCCGGPRELMLEEGPYTGNPDFNTESESNIEESVIDHFANSAVVVFQQSVLEIPTASTVGLGLLSLALAGAGFWLIRR